MFIIFTIIQLPMVIFANRTGEICEKHDHLMAVTSVPDVTSDEKFNITFHEIYQSGLSSLPSFTIITPALDNEVIGVTEISDTEVLFATWYSDRRHDKNPGRRIKFKVCSFAPGNERCNLLDDAIPTKQHTYNDHYMTTTDEHGSINACYGTDSMAKPMFDCATLEKYQRPNGNQRFSWSRNSGLSAWTVDNGWWNYRQGIYASQNMKICMKWRNIRRNYVNYDQAMCLSISESDWDRQKSFHFSDEFRFYDLRNSQILARNATENMTKWTSFNFKLHPVGTYYSLTNSSHKRPENRIYSINGSNYAIAVHRHAWISSLVVLGSIPNESRVFELKSHSHYLFSVTTDHCVIKANYSATDSNTIQTTSFAQAVTNATNTHAISIGQNRTSTPQDTQNGDIDCIIYIVVLSCTILVGCGFVVFEIKTCRDLYNKNGQFPWFTVKRTMVKDGTKQQSLEKDESMTISNETNSNQDKDKPEEPQQPTNEGSYKTTTPSSKSMTVTTRSTGFFNVPIDFNSDDDQSNRRCS